MTDKEYNLIEKYVCEYESTGREELVPLFIDEINPQKLNHDEPHFYALQDLYYRYMKAKEKWKKTRYAIKDYVETYAQFIGLDKLAYQHRQLLALQNGQRQQDADTQESKVVRTKISDKRRNVSDWAITDAQKTAIRKIIDDGDRTKRSKRETVKHLG